jgi:hypothetical protein
MAMTFLLAIRPGAGTDKDMTFRFVHNDPPFNKNKSLPILDGKRPLRHNINMLLFSL